MVVPVFYDVDPSEVRNQTNGVGKAFFEIEAQCKDDMKVRKWKTALKEVGGLSGWNIRNRSESEFIQEIIQWLNSTITSQAELYVAKYLVGIKPRLQHLYSLLSGDKKEILMVGIYGVGGIGKTTIAKAVYNSIASQFDGSCFLPNIRETSQKNGLIHLQNKLLAKVLRASSIEVDNVDQGITMMKQRLCSKKVFLVLDDVNQSIQLENLAGKHDWFRFGSKIIITTRDNGLLSRHGVNVGYHLNELNDEEALELFSWNAFKSLKPTKDFIEITKEVLSYARGLPLALEVMGSDLFGRSLHEWRSTLDRYKRIPNKDIQNILRVSYDELDDNEKNIFLDIACFFVGKDLDDVSKILDKCGFFPYHGIGVLVNKSLITTKGNILQMHNLLRDMGKELVRQESPEDPGKRSRLWFHGDVRRVLEGNTGTNKVEGILVDLPKEDQICLSPKVFKKMRNLRLFINHNGKFSIAPNYLSNELRILDWFGFPGEFLPSNFRGDNLITLNLRGSALKTFQTLQNFQNLLSVEFSNCNFLKELPDISRLPNLGKLVVGSCDNLVTVHPSVGSHDKLHWLDFHNCINLKSLPRRLKMRSSSILYLDDCPRLMHFPEIEWPLELTCASLSTSCTEELRSCWEFIQPGEPLLSITIVDGFLNMIYPPQSRQSIEFTTEFETSSSAESSLLPPETNSYVGRAFPMTSRCSSLLTFLNLSGSNIISLPNCIQDCCHLNKLYLNNCRKLKEVLRLPPYLKYLFAINCESLENFRLSKCQSPWIAFLDLPGCRLLQDIENDIHFYLLSEDYPKYPRVEVLYTGYEIPNWFSYKKIANGNSCGIDIIDLPSFEGEIRRIAFCVVAEKVHMERFHQRVGNKISVILICDGLEIFTEFLDLLSVPMNCSYLDSESITLMFRSSESSNLKGDSMQVCFRCEAGVPVLVSCGVHLIHGREEKATDLMMNPDDMSRKRPLDDDGGNLESNQYPQRRKHLTISGGKKFKRLLSISGMKKFKRHLSISVKKLRRQKSSEQEESSGQKSRKKKKKTTTKKFWLL